MRLRPSAAGTDVRKFQLIAAGLVVLAAIALAVVALSRDARRLAATNNVPTNGVAAEIARGDTCAGHEVPVQAGSAGVRAFVVQRPGTGTNSSLAAVLRVDGAVVGRGVGSREGTGLLVVPFTREVSGAGSGTVCFTNVGDRSIVGFGGTSRDRAADSPLQVEGKRVREGPPWEDSAAISTASPYPPPYYGLRDRRIQGHSKAAPSSTGCSAHASSRHCSER